MEYVPCTQRETCPLRDTVRGCYTDVHHSAFPRRDYKKGVAQLFRNLDENKTRMCRQEHNDLHAIEEPPEKPTLDEMWEAIKNTGRVAVEGAA